MSYDLIIITQSVDGLINITQNCINSARIDGTELNVIIVETGQPYIYKGVNKFIEYNGEFNYNRALNMGLKYVKNEVHILANNDLVFHPGWSNIGELMKANGYHSASCMSGNIGYTRGDFLYEGYNIESILTGWCLFVDRYCIEKIGKLDEACTFWFSDNLYACQIRAEGIKHALFCNCQVDHIISQTLKRQPSRVQRQYQMGEFTKFNQRAKYYAQIEKMHEVNT
jgi:hypothetical protein